MAKVIFTIFIVTAWRILHSHSSPVKRALTDKITTDDCYGTDCYYSPDDFDTSIDAKILENLTHSIMSVLPKIEAAQSEAVALQNKTLASQENVLFLLEKNAQHIENMTKSVSSVLQNQDQEIKHISSTLTKMTEILGNVADLMTCQTNLQVAPPARNCQDTTPKAVGMSGSYSITPQDGLGSLDVYCDMETNGGGWTVFQKRYDGSVDFFRSWQNYENGFGSSNGEYWLGLSNVRRLLSDGRNWTLRIDLEAYDGEKVYAEYDSFMIGDEASNYRLTVGNYNGNAGDSINRDNHQFNHNGMPFSSLGRDNDRSPSHCANKYKAGWWFNSCVASNLNGLYSGASIVGQGMGWYTWRDWEQLKKSEMKIRHQQ